MAKIKSYTDIEQSNILAEILPIESADMWFYPYPNDEYWYDVPNMGNADKKYNQLPCWSLTALLNVLPSATLDSSNDHHFRIHCMERYTEWYDNAVDACVEMIIRLNKLKIL